MAALSNLQFAGLLKRARRIAAEGQAVQQELTAAFMDRYGVTYSDVDADELIDELDYHGGNEQPLTVADVDRIMTETGNPPK